jgi:hypothetical protein
MGAGAEIVEVEETVVEVAIAGAFFSDRVAYMAAVIPAPVAALAAAIKARVDLDIFARGFRRARGAAEGYLFRRLSRVGLVVSRFETFSGTIRRA